MKTTSFSKNLFIILGHFMTIMLLVNLVHTRKSKAQKRQEAQAKKSVPAFQEDQCFCGVRYDKTKKLNLDLFGPGVAGKIVNYVDQSISKFNALGLRSHHVIASNKNRTNGSNPYEPTHKEFLNIMNKRGQLTMNHDQGDNLRITFLRSIKFFNDSSQNKIMLLEFMMGRKVSFQVEIKMLNYGKKQFDMNIQQMPYIPGDPVQTNELIRKKQFDGYKTSRSLSHFDKNQLEVDVCRMMYTALNQMSIREFKVSISDNIVRYGKTRSSYKNAVGCQRDVIFNKRFKDDQMVGIVQTYFSKLEKINYGFLKAKLKKNVQKDIYLVNQQMDEKNNTLNRQASQSKLDLFDDDSENDEDSNKSETQDSPNKTGLQRQNNTIKDIDNDTSESSETSMKSAAKIQRQNNMYDTKQDVYELRNRNVPKIFKNDSSSNSSNDKNESSLNVQKQLEQSHKSDDVTPYNWSERTPEEHNMQSKKSDDVTPYNWSERTPEEHNTQSKKSDDVTPYNWSERTPEEDKINPIKEKLKEEFMNRLYNNQEDESYKTTLDEQVEMIAKKKRKRVIVLIETIECSKCRNDINTEIFLRLLNNKSFMI